ncbi:hypothetical protein GCM10023089_39200 [Quisquiliibacterium transsilvanicum]
MTGAGAGWSGLAARSADALLRAAAGGWAGCDGCDGCAGCDGRDDALLSARFGVPEATVSP